MDSAATFLLPHYRQALAEALASHEQVGRPPCHDVAPELWARTGEAAGWLDPADAIRIRRLAEKVRFYEGRVVSSERYEVNGERSTGDGERSTVNSQR